MPDLWGWSQIFGFDYVFCMAGEFVLTSFLLRRIAVETVLRTYPVIAVYPKLADTLTSIAQSVEQSPPLRLVVLGQPLALDKLWHLQAEEHYVLLDLRDGPSQLLRGRLADVIAQVPAEAGLQVHLSHWLATSAVQSLGRRRSGWLLHLHNGITVPAARNRQTTFRDWVEASTRSAVWAA